MIVVPTYNGQTYLSGLISALQRHGTGGHKVLFVDTGTTDPYSLSVLASAPTLLDGIEVVKTERGGYETGALATAVRKYQDEQSFLLLHDTAVPTCDDWIHQFESRIDDETPVVAWLKFQPCFAYCHSGHIDYIVSIVGHQPASNPPDSGIFGSMFLAQGEILRKIDEKGYFNAPVADKMQSECWERIWPILFHMHGHKVGHIVPHFDRPEIEKGNCPVLRKFFKGRT